MKFFAVVVLMAVVGAALAAKLPAEESLGLKPEAETAEAGAAEPRDKRGLLYAAPYAAAYSLPYASAYSYPSAYAYSAYSAPIAYSAYRSAYYPSYVSSYIVG